MTAVNLLPVPIWLTKDTDHETVSGGYKEERNPLVDCVIKSSPRGESVVDTVELVQRGKSQSRRGHKQASERQSYSAIHFPRVYDHRDLRVAKLWLIEVHVETGLQRREHVLASVYTEQLVSSAAPMDVLLALNCRRLTNPFVTELARYCRIETDVALVTHKCVLQTSQQTTPSIYGLSHHESLYSLFFCLIPRLHDTTGCQTGSTTGLTTGCIV